MAFGPQSRVFEKLRAGAARGGLTDAQVRRAAAYVARSPTLTGRMDDFEAAGGRLAYSENGANYYETVDERPCIRLDPGLYANSAPGAQDANVESLVEVLAHETSHYLTYFKEKLNPNDCGACDDAGAAGVHDEARAYATEYVVQAEINRTAGPSVDWMKKGQLEAILPRVQQLPPEATREDVLHAATCGLIEWAANWTGPDESAGGYFQFYRNEWLRLAAKPTETIELRSVRITQDDDGTITRVAFRRAGMLVAVNIGHGLDTATRLA
jgi:hypothetical protein